MERNKIMSWLKFCKVRGIGSSKVLKLLGIFGDFDKLFVASEDQLYRTRIFSKQMIEQLKEIKEEDELMEKFILDICDEEKINIIPIFSEDYPSNLKNLPDAPLTLYAQGNMDLLKGKKIAIVGSRESENSALKWALNISRNLVKENIIIVSGGATGIDYQAHNGALNLKGKTVSVLGSGLLRLYPSENREMFEKIKKREGLLVSEHSPTDKGGRLSLLRRNRIISGISDSIIIVTSKKIGGSRTQIDIANKQRLPIFVPDLSLNLLPNEGIYEAIKQHKIIEVKDFKQVLEKTYSNNVNISTQRTL